MFLVQIGTFRKSNSAVSVSPDFRHDVPRRYKAFMLFGSISSAVLHYKEKDIDKYNIEPKENYEKLTAVFTLKWSSNFW